MQSNGKELHPNWRALATVHLPLKRFIKATDGSEKIINSLEEQRYDIQGVNGTEAKEFYEEIIKETSTTDLKKFKEKSDFSKFSKQDVLIKSAPRVLFDRSKYFRFAQNNDVTGLRSFQIDAGAPELNSVDEFGWTALMIAACEGACDAVKELVQMGVDRKALDKTGRSAIDLARKNGHASVVKFLESKILISNKPLKVRKLKEPMPKNPFYCEICQCHFKETTLTAHQTSTVHQFNDKSEMSTNKLERFNIPQRNRGLQLMVKQGWDKESGLGPSQNGRLYPVKTVIRDKRTGFGVEQPPARVTHFDAFDVRAIQFRGPDHCTKKQPSRSDIRREKVREWKRNRRLRHELS